MRRLAARLYLKTLGVRAKALGIRPVAKVPYATHLPVLAALAKIRSVRRVLELGSGPFSTHLFLNRAVFPELQLLVSYEDDPKWSPVVLGEVGTDERLEFRMVEAVRHSVPVALDEYDLIFIDDSRTFAERSLTIRTVAERRPRGVVTVHDFEHHRYRIASKKFDSLAIFRTFTPQVGVMWNNGAVDLRRLAEAVNLIEAGVEIDVTNYRAWNLQLASL